MTALWNNTSVNLLIDVWGDERIQEMLDSSYRNSDVFKEIAEKLNENEEMEGMMTWEQCRNKIKSLRCEYRKAKRSGSGKSKFFFFDKIDGILRDRPDSFFCGRPDGPAPEPRHYTTSFTDSKDAARHYTAGFTNSSDAVRQYTAGFTDSSDAVRHYTPDFTDSSDAASPPIKRRRKVAVYMPSTNEVQQLSDDLRLKCTKEEVEGFHEHFKGTMEYYERVKELSEVPLPVKYPRIPGHKDDTDPAWAWRCNIKGADGGILKGKTVGIKDNVAVAGVPMTNGSDLLEGYTPEFDATVVTRILDAGGELVGKTTCEDLCISGSSWTAASGPVPNPYDPTKSTGGSSSGSASLIARGIIDMAIGGDQGGSIRIPACWCGIVGLKPTYGLVPYTGIMPIEPTLDHTGPMANTVYDCALLLQAIAGFDDRRDFRQAPNMSVPEYSKMIDRHVHGKRVGLVKEGFEFDLMDEEVASTVRDAATFLTGAGITVEEVSIPLHSDGLAIWTPIFFEGAHRVMIKGNGFGFTEKGHYCTSLLEALARGYNLRPHDFSMSTKLFSMFGEFIDRNYQNKFYAKAQNLSRRLTKAYDDALEQHDVLIMPTLPQKPMKLPTEEDSIHDTLELTFGMLKNTAPFNVTGHPALSINVKTEGAPIGMMIIGKHYDEVTVFQIAKTFEKYRDAWNWKEKKLAGLGDDI